MAQTQKFELTFFGGVMTRLPRHRRWHATYEAAVAAATRVLAAIPNRAAHPAIIYGPGCGRDGRTVA